MQTIYCCACGARPGERRLCDESPAPHYCAECWPQFEIRHAVRGMLGRGWVVRAEWRPYQPPTTLGEAIRVAAATYGLNGQERAWIEAQAELADERGLAWDIPAPPRYVGVVTSSRRR